MNELSGDGIEYHILFESALSIKSVPGIVCEIGTRLGGSLHCIIDALMYNSDYGRNLACIDPYGNIEYFVKSEEKKIKYGYTNGMRNTAYKNIYQFVENLPVNVVMFCLEDTEFFKRFHDGVPFYQEYKIVETQYSLVYFDGPHTLDCILTEVEFFCPRASIGAHFVFDDISWYDHNAVENYLFKNNFTLVKKGNSKASYVKIA